MNRYLYRNIEHWKNTDNVLFITGVGGSGKTTLSNLLAVETKCEAIHFDNFYGMAFDDHIGDDTHLFFKEYRMLYNSIPWGKITWKTRNLTEYCNACIAWLYERCKRSDKNYIIEGISIKNCGPKFMPFYQDKSIIITYAPRSDDFLSQLHKFIKFFHDWKTNTDILGSMIRHDFNSNQSSRVVKFNSFDRIYYTGKKYVDIDKVRPIWISDKFLNRCHSIYSEVIDRIKTRDAMVYNNDVSFKPLSSGPPALKKDFIYAHLYKQHSLQDNHAHLYIHDFGDFYVLFVTSEEKGCLSYLISSAPSVFSKYFYRINPNMLNDILYSIPYYDNFQDTTLNLDKWHVSTCNTLFVLGLSGSGKTTTVNEIAKDCGAIVGSIDDLNRITADLEHLYIVKVPISRLSDNLRGKPMIIKTTAPEYCAIRKMRRDNISKDQAIHYVIESIDEQKQFDQFLNP